MISLISNLFRYFAVETGILGEFQQYQKYGTVIIVSLAVMCCFLGIKTYRVIFSVLMFAGIALLCCFGMEDIAQWGTIVTTFAILGCALGFFAYQWKYLGTVVISGLMAAGLIFVAASECAEWLLILVAVLAGAAAYACPLIVTALITAVWGSYTLAEILKPDGINYLLVLAVMAAGFVLQMVIGKKTRAFARE